MGSKRRAPCRLFGFAEISLRLIDGLFDHINRHFERSGSMAMSPALLLKSPAQSCSSRRKPFEMFL
jgi:hypothetical protein